MMKRRLLSLVILLALLAAGLVPLDSAEASSCTWHVVKRGQNLTQISRYYGVSVTAIVRANGIRNPSVIYRGQSLCIPTGYVPKQPPPSGKDCYKIHVVQRGEYLKIIAPRYGVTVTAIVRANGLSNPNRIYVGQRLKIPYKCVTPKPKPEPKPKPKPPTNKPWKGEYYTNRDLAGRPKFVRYVAKIDMDWGYGGPPDLGRSDDFSIRWTRTMHFNGGTYFFHIKSKDGVRLLVDGHMLIDEWRTSDYAMNYTAEKALSYGKHTVRVDYFNHTGPARVHLQIEPISNGEPGPDGGVGDWQTEYWNNKRLEGSAAWTTRSRDVVFDWGWGSPKPGIAADFFSARYVGDFHFSGGRYRFYAMSDDGVRVWVDDTLILDQWRIQAPTTFTSDVDIGEGSHRVKVEYFENTGVAKLKVLWSKR